MARPLLMVTTRFRFLMSLTVIVVSGKSSNVLEFDLSQISDIFFFLSLLASWFIRMLVKFLSTIIKFDSFDA